MFAEGEMEIIGEVETVVVEVASESEFSSVVETELPVVVDDELIIFEEPVIDESEVVEVVVVDEMGDVVTSVTSDE